MRIFVSVTLGGVLFGRKKKTKSEKIAKKKYPFWKNNFKEKTELKKITLEKQSLKK